MLNVPRYLDCCKPITVRLIGLGNSGVNLADYLLNHLQLPMDIVVMNSDQQSLTSSIAPGKVVLGRQATRGLGCGGDPLVGEACARESEADIRDAVAGADVVFVAAGLGGGTGSGVMPAVLRAARENGSLAVAVVTTPFPFEGQRRVTQAAAALRGVHEAAHAVLHFPNERMGDLAGPQAGAQEAFSGCDRFLAGCIYALCELMSCSGPLEVGLPDLLQLLQGSGACLFGVGQAEGDLRMLHALERALKSPLLDRGRALDEAAALLVHVSGPPNLSFFEVQSVLQEVQKRISDHTLLHIGLSTHAQPGAPVTVTLFGKHAPVAEAKPVRPPAIATPAPAPVRQMIRPASRPLPETLLPQLEPLPQPVESETPQPSAPEPIPEPQSVFPTEEPPSAEPVMEPQPSDNPVRFELEHQTVERQPLPTPSAFISPISCPPSTPDAPQPVAPPAGRRTAAKSATKPSGPKARQEVLPLDNVMRGRFDNSEPTIVEGEDLDVPTFLRRRKS